jgi:hypothetical protein
MEEKTKECNTCHVVKPLSEYHLNSKAKDGHQNTCKECACKRTRSWNALKSIVRGIPSDNTPSDGNPLAQYEAKDLISELRRRGYYGNLKYEQRKIWEIKV